MLCIVPKTCYADFSLRNPDLLKFEKRFGPPPRPPLPNHKLVIVCVSIALLSQRNTGKHINTENIDIENDGFVEKKRLTHFNKRSKKRLNNGSFCFIMVDGAN